METLTQRFYITLNTIYLLLELKQDSNVLSSIFKWSTTQLSTIVFSCLTILTITQPTIASIDDKSVLDKITHLSDEFHNHIPLLNNRFRIDSDINEVTLVFFREYGAPPIVLVKPDGSKLYLENDLSDDSYEWFETDTYDMISLKKPMPGPWQAVGEILPHSKVIVIAGISLKAQPIPDKVYSGETLKQTAYILNAGSRVNMAAFKDVVSLSIEFVSTNNPDFPNFGLGTRQVARFHDDGLRYDEENSDGVFTGEFDLNIIEGEWQPVFTIRTPLFSREQSTSKVQLLANPAIVTHQIDYNEDKDHLIQIDVDRNEIDINSVVIQGTVKQPSGEELQFSITEQSDQIKEVEVLNTGYGVYRMNAQIFANTKSGRDIVLTIPEYNFITREPIVEIEVPEVELEQALLEPEIVEPPTNPLILVLTINLILIIVFSVVIFLVYDMRKRPDNHVLLKVKCKLSSLVKKKTKENEAPSDAKK